METMTFLYAAAFWLLVAGVLFLLPYVYDRVAGGCKAFTIEQEPEPEKGHRDARSHEHLGYQWKAGRDESREEAQEAEGAGPRCRLVSWNVAGFSSPWNLHIWVDRRKHTKHVDLPFSRLHLQRR